MPIHNRDIANQFYEVADYLEIDGANPFRIRAYRNAARRIERLPDQVTDLADPDSDRDLTAIEGIGEDLAHKIQNIVENGEFPLLNQLRQKMPDGIRRLMQINGLGPKRVQQLYQELDIQNLDDLKTALRTGKIKTLDGFGQKLSDQIRQEIENLSDQSRFLRPKITDTADDLINYLTDHPTIGQATICGSYRRKKETVGDLDILITCADLAAGMDHFIEFEDITDIPSQGEDKSTVRLKRGITVDIRVVNEHQHGSGIQYFTGSKAHNVALRKRANKRGMTINEYGLFDQDNDDTPIAAKSEQSIYDALDLPLIPPVLRQGAGEIEAAEKDALPTLITPDDIRGNLHTHTTGSDGEHSLKQMALAGRDIGWDYLAITDHSPYLGVAQGLDSDGLRDQITEIKQLNDELDDILLLAGVEVDILPDHTLDLDNDILDELDIVLGAIHSGMDQHADEQTERYLSAIKSGLIDIIAHPTGRIIQKRPPMDLHWPDIFDAAHEYDVALEVSAQPDRLDLTDKLIRRAVEANIKLSINTDAHHTHEYQVMRHGVFQAQRGWAEASDVINTYDPHQLIDWLD